MTFQTDEIDEIVEARLEEMFDAINNELKKAGRASKLPSGVVLTGGTANLKGIAEYAKQSLGLAARVGKSSGYGGVADDIEKPQFATVIGLMLMDSDTASVVDKRTSKKSGKGALKSGAGAIGRFMDRFKS